MINLKRKINFEKELRDFYRNEADSLSMPDENDIEVIRRAKEAKRTTKKSAMVYRYGTLVASAAVLVLLIMAIPFLRMPGNDVPSLDNPSSSLQTNEGNTDPGNSGSRLPPDNGQSNNDDPAKTYPDLTTLSLSQWIVSENVVWMSGSPTKGNVASGEIIELGQVRIDEELAASFASNSTDAVYAVMVDFTSMCNDDFVFEGKKISELIAEKDDLIALGKMEDAKALAQKINQAKEAYYFSMLEKFEEKFASMGLGVYHEDRGCTIDNCIFYTFATQAQLEEFECNETQAFIFSAAVRFK